METKSGILKDMVHEWTIKPTEAWSAEYFVQVEVLRIFHDLATQAEVIEETKKRLDMVTL